MGRGAWNIEKSRELYGLDRPYVRDLLDVSPDGRLCLKIRGRTIPLKEIADELNARGLSTAIIRVPAWIEIFMDRIYHAFEKAIKKYGYKGEFRGVFPLKVNQRVELVKWVVRLGKKYKWGLEVGSKPELLIALAQELHEDALIICNGIKDWDFLRLALMGMRLGKNIIIVLDSLEEMRRITRIYDELREGDGSWRPRLGVRCKLLTPGAGIWEESGGRYSKFGLSSSEIKGLISVLKGREEWLELIHFHIGSQITKIERIASAVTEITTLYAELRRRGFDSLNKINVGGGLAVDYEGTLYGDSGNSADYDYEEYADSIVGNISRITSVYGVEDPIIVSESGRALVAYHELLLAKVVETRDYSFPSDISVDKLIDDVGSIGLARPLPVLRMSKIMDALEEAEGLPDLVACARALAEEERITIEEREKALGLEDRVAYELIVGRIEHGLCKRLRELLEQDKISTSDIRELLREEAIARILTTPSKRYVANLSLFNQMLDVPAFGQLFPIVPVSRLDEKPDYLVRLADITCDSYGEVKTFVTKVGESSGPVFTELDDRLVALPGERLVLSGVPLHELGEGESYFVAILFIGAYQDILATKHNLLGDVAIVVVDVGEDGEPLIDIIREPENTEKLLKHMGYDMDKTMKSLVKLGYNEELVKKVAFSSPYFMDSPFALSTRASARAQAI